MSPGQTGQHTRIRISLEGSVQGFGFRTTVYRIAQKLHLTGWVRNNNAGLEIEVEGSAGQIVRFQREVEAQRPAASQLTRQTIQRIDSQNSLWFEILPDPQVSTPGDAGN